MKILIKTIAVITLILSTRSADARYLMEMGRYNLRPYVSGAWNVGRSMRPAIEVQRQFFPDRLTDATSDHLDGPNLYEYTYSRPVNLLDPSGLIPPWDAGPGVQPPPGDDEGIWRDPLGMGDLGCQKKCAKKVLGIDNIAAFAAGGGLQCLNKTCPKPRGGIAGGGPSGGWTSWTRRICPNACGKLLGRLSVGTVAGGVGTAYMTAEYCKCMFDCKHEKIGAR